MKTRFRVNRNDTVKIQLVDKEGKLLTTLYDSGFTTIKQCYNTVLSKCCNPPKETRLIFIMRIKTLIILTINLWFVSPPKIF